MAEDGAKPRAGLPRLHPGCRVAKVGRDGKRTILYQVLELFVRRGHITTREINLRGQGDWRWQRSAGQRIRELRELGYDIGVGPDPADSKGHRWEMAMDDRYRASLLLREADRRAARRESKAVGSTARQGSRQAGLTAGSSGADGGASPSPAVEETTPETVDLGAGPGQAPRPGSGQACDPPPPTPPTSTAPALRRPGSLFSDEQIRRAVPPMGVL